MSTWQNYDRKYCIVHTLYMYKYIYVYICIYVYIFCLEEIYTNFSVSFKDSLLSLSKENWKLHIKFENKLNKSKSSNLINGA